MREKAKEQWFGFEKEKEAFQEKERRHSLDKLKQEIIERHKAYAQFAKMQRERLRFDMKAHNTRMYMIEAEAKARAVANKKMVWGYSPEDTRKMALARGFKRPLGKNRNLDEFQGIHATDLKSFRHKIATTFQYSTAGMMYIGLLKGLRTATEAIINFNKYSATMAAVFRINSKEADALTTKLEDLGNTLGGNQEDIYKIALALGRAGVATKDLSKASEVVIRMAYLTGDSFNEATNAIISYSEVFGVGKGGMGYTIQELGDKLAYVANVSRLSTQDIGIFSNYALGAAKAAGLTVDAVGAMAAAFSNAGMNASTIGTQIRRFTTLLSDQTTSIKGFFRSIGISQGAFRKELMASMDGTVEGARRSNEAMRSFAARLKSLTDNEFAQFTSGMDLLARNSLTFIRQEADAFSTYLDGSLHKANGLLAESDAILKTYLVTWEKLTNQIQTFFAALGDSYLFARLNRGVSDILGTIQYFTSDTKELLDMYGNTRAFENLAKAQIALKEATEQYKFGNPYEKSQALIRMTELRNEIQVLKKQVEKDIADAEKAQQDAEIKTARATIKALEDKINHPNRYNLTKSQVIRLKDQLEILQNQYNKIKETTEIQTKQNQKIREAVQYYKESSAAISEQLAAMKYLDKLKLESWATMVSQLSTNLPKAMAALNSMTLFADKKQQQRILQAQSLVNNISESIGIKPTDKQNFNFVTEYITKIKDVESASEAMFDISKDLAETEQKIAELKAQNVDSNNKDLIYYEKRRDILQDTLDIAKAAAQDYTQLQKAINAVYKNSERQIESYNSLIENLASSNELIKQKIEHTSGKTALHQQAINKLKELNKLEKEQLEFKEKYKDNPILLKKTEAQLKAIKMAKAAIVELDRQQVELSKQWVATQAYDKAEKLLTKYKTELENINLRLKDRNVEQDRYVQLIIAANQARKYGYTGMARELEQLHDELKIADKKEKIKKRRERTNPLKKQLPKYADITAVYEYDLKQLQDQYDGFYKFSVDYYEKKKALDQQYAEDLRLLNVETLNAYFKMLDAQDKYTKQITDSLRGSFEDFFDYTSDGFLDMGKMAEQVLHDIYMTILRQNLTDPFSRMLGETVGPFFNNLFSSAHGNVFVTKKYATGGVVTRPTIFPMATGVGLMGEAGAEAIMPLTRINGDLGVKAVGGPVVINVTNETGLPIDLEKVNEEMSDDGTRIIQVVMEHAQTNPDFRQIMGITT